MKTLNLSIAAIISVIAFGASTVHSSYSAEFNATMDKMYYNDTDTAHVVITGPPSTLVNLTIIDSSNQQKLANVVQLDPNGTGIFSFNLTSFTDGIYYALVGQGYDRIKIGFDVGIFPAEMGGVIEFTLPKYDYTPSGIIQIQGSGQPDSIVRMDLIDPYGVSENSTQVTSDGSGNFRMEIGIPSSAVNGTWHLSASSGVNHRTLDVVIHSSNPIPPIPYSILRSAAPTLTPSENQTVVSIALSVPGLQSWSHDWRYVSTGFLGNNKLATVGFEWQYAMVDLKTPPNSGLIPCDQGWEAEVTVDMTTMKVVSADYPTMESHNCDNYITGGGPGTSEISPTIESPLKQFESGIPISNIQCAQDLSLVIKEEDGTPACIKQDSISKLILRGWVGITPHIDQNNVFGEFYQGIEKDSGIVSIKNQTYYMMTAADMIYPITPGTTKQFHQVTFSFPYGSIATPGGVLIPFDMTFPDGTTESYGKITKNPDGSGSMSGIGTGPGPLNFNRTTTVLSDHIHPQAGVSIYAGETIKLLVSTDVGTTNTQTQTSDSSAALKLHLSTTSQVIQPGQPIGITISINNTLSNQVVVQDENSWKLNNLSVNPCTTIPYGIAIFDGFYSEQNMTEGRPLAIFNNAVLCPAYNQTTQTYVFQPSSGHVTVNNCMDTPSACSSGFDMGDQLSFSGVWKYGQIESFSPGPYTIVGGDEWGHVVIEHFVVSNSTIFAGELGSINCPLISGGVQFGAVIKNSTGFAHYYNSGQYGHTFFLHPGMQGKINVQYSAPANASWFQNNGNTPFNMTNGAALFYMANVTKSKTTISYAVSLYNDERGHHSQICHYHTPYGGFAEPCNFDNTGDIPLGELADASKVLHVGINTSFEPNSVMLYPNSNPVFTSIVSANSDARPGVYWLSLGRSLCGPGVLAKLVVLP